MGYAEAWDYVGNTQSPWRTSRTSVYPLKSRLRPSREKSVRRLRVLYVIPRPGVPRHILEYQFFYQINIIAMLVEYTTAMQEYNRNILYTF